MLDLAEHGAAQLWRPEDPNAMREGVTVHVDRVPKDVTIIRFVNSY